MVGKRGRQDQGCAEAAARTPGGSGTPGHGAAASGTSHVQQV
jgi:hypothetical protein